MLRYSIDAYMNCVDACYQTLKHKMNGRWEMPGRL